VIAQAFREVNSKDINNIILDMINLGVRKHLISDNIHF